jgi:Uri superfamily endonuclease
MKSRPTNTDKTTEINWSLEIRYVLGAYQTYALHHTANDQQPTKELHHGDRGHNWINQCENASEDHKSALNKIPKRMPLNRFPSRCLVHFQCQIADLASSDQQYATADRIPASPGAYLLLIELRAVTPVILSNKPSVTMARGRYIYAGSAYAPGGLKGRVSRHMRRAKRTQWHIDQLTETDNILGAWAFPGDFEWRLCRYEFGITDPNCRIW